MKAGDDTPELGNGLDPGGSPYGVPYLPGMIELPGVTRFPRLDLNSVDTFGRVAGALDSPAQLAFFERLFLYGLIVAWRPQRTIEIGFGYDGSAYLMMCALEDVGLMGRLVSIDPKPQPAVDFSAFGDRFRLLVACSPGALEPAVQELGGPAQLCFIDGDHTEEGVRRDLSAILPCMSQESYIVLRDACYPAVRRAIAGFLRERPDLIDSGAVARQVDDAGWGGLHVIRVASARRGSLPAALRVWRRLLGVSAR